jgi:LacI family transcriptional regulator
LLYVPTKIMPQDKKRTPTMREVAKLAHVGLMTVSRVLNNHPSVRQTTRKRVESAIAQLGYQQNEAARMMKGQRAKMIGLVVPDLSDQFFAACAHTIQQIAREQGYMTLVVSSERDAELELQQAQLMATRMFSGLLIVSSARVGDVRLRDLQNSGLTIVAFDRPLPGVITDAVVVENRTGAEEATKHLIDHGHTRIVCIGYDEEAYTVQERIIGYKTIMHAHGLKPQAKLGLLTLEDVRGWLSAIMQQKDRPTAIFSLNHRTSTFLLRALADQRILVPKDMAVVGFDDFDLAELISPALTAVAQFPVELARRAINLLLDRIQNPQTDTAEPPAKIVLPTKLVIRSSCGEHKLTRS